MAFFSAGFRPLFFFAALWSALGMALWIVLLTGAIDGPELLSGIDWHVHELTFGYTSAVLCGFLLTAIPNWTGRPPLHGAPLAGLVALWIAARAAAFWDWGMVWVIATQLGFLTLFTAFALREILAAGNKRNLVVIALVALFGIANAWFLWDIIQGNSAFNGAGQRLGLGITILLIALIGGRITPNFTRNWLRKNRPDAALPPDFGPLDRAAMVTSAAAILIWIVIDLTLWAAPVMALAGVLQTLRLSRWRAMQVRGEALMLGLHIAYAFIPIGFFLWTAASLDLAPSLAATHAWTAGAMGLMTLTVMCRATLGHSGRALIAGGMERAMIAAITGSTALRILSTFDAASTPLLHSSAALWILGFALFALRYARIMTSPRLT